MSFHPTNRSNRDLIINSIPWDPAIARKNPEVGEWVGKVESDRTVSPDSIYQITDTNHVTTSAKEFLKISSCRNPTLAKCGGEAQHLEKLGIWSPPGLPNVQSSTARGKTSRIGVFLVSLERS
jgi:hypothetical protein